MNPSSRFPGNAPGNPADADVARDARVHVTDWGGMLRIDLNMLGSVFGREPVDGWTEWSLRQNRRLCDFMAAEVAKHGGTFSSVAEWTVAVNQHYGLQDMREVRVARFADGFRSAITTLPWGNPASPQSVSIQAVAYVPKDSRDHFALRAWQPKCIYDCAFLGLAPAVTVETGSVKLLYIAGVVAWDQAIKPLAGDDPRAQVRIVLQKIQAVCVEAGGSPGDVVRLRPFTASKTVAQIVREECTRLWTDQGHPAPVLLVAEETTFWGAPALHTEIQAMAVIGGAQDEIPIAGITGGATRIRRTTTPQWTMFHISELRAPAATALSAEAGAIGRQVARVMQELSLAPGDVSLAMAYGSSAEVLTQLAAILGDQLEAAALHLVQAPSMPELAGGTVKLELTARKLK